jgi:hypothetical protein
MDEHELTTEKYFLCVETLKLWGCDENIFNLISEDLSYHLRQVVEYASSFMQHSKRTRLKINDVELAFEVYKTEVVQVFFALFLSFSIKFNKPKEAVWVLK